MKSALTYILAFLALAYYVGCAKKNFNIDQTQVDSVCAQSNGCVKENGILKYNYSTKTTGGQVDILFVNDNSGSMSFEQKSMAQRFGNFISTLEAANLDYRIAITTTDISTSENGPRAINQNGALQDGRLIKFSDGTSFLTPTSGGSMNARVQMFAQAIQRPETLQCETFLNNNPNEVQGSANYMANCPSGDERGIFAANLVVQNNPNSFLREKGSLALVILADEDVRSSNYDRIARYTLSANDLPATLMAQVQTKFPDKTFAAHSIIVRPGGLSVTVSRMNEVYAFIMDDPEPLTMGYKHSNYFSTSGSDSACLTAQGNQMAGASGSYGYVYAVLTRATGGIEGNVCAADYGSQLSTISSTIVNKLDEVALRCSPVNDLQVNVVPAVNGLTHSVVGSNLKFSQPLPPATQLDLSYSCPSPF